MNELRKNAKKTSIFGHFGPKWPILDSFWPKWAKREFLFKKALGTFFSHLQALTNCKVSEKSNERFSSNSVADARTYGCESLGLQWLRRETKKLFGTFSHFWNIFVARQFKYNEQWFKKSSDWETKTLTTLCGQHGFPQKRRKKFWKLSVWGQNFKISAKRDPVMKYYSTPRCAKNLFLWGNHIQTCGDTLERL